MLTFGLILFQCIFFFISKVQHSENVGPLQVQHATVQLKAKQKYSNLIFSRLKHMSFLNPFNWASSVIIAKVVDPDFPLTFQFLSPYFKNLDEKNVEIGFWKGEVLLRKLELNKSIVNLSDQNIEMEASLIDEFKLTIPWKALNTEPIVLDIKGIKVCLSQDLSTIKHKGANSQNILQDMKREALKNFDTMIKGKLNAEDDGQGGYFTSLTNSIGQNLTVRISNLEFVFIFHLSNQEIVKFGVKLDSLELCPYKGQDFSNKNVPEIYLRKILNIKGLSSYFDVYDETFVKKYQNQAPGANQDKIIQVHNFILNDLDVNLDVEIRMAKQTEIKAAVNISPLLLHFNQKQIKFLIIFSQKFSETQSSRPKYRPTEKRSIVLWWRYAFRRVAESESIKYRAKSHSVSSIVNEERYKQTYTKKCISSSLTNLQEQRFLERFETETDLATILKIRNIVLDELRLMNYKLRKGDKNERQLAQEWFKSFDQGFSTQKGVDISLDKKKAEEKLPSIKASVNFQSVAVLIRENDIVDSLKNLQEHVFFFKNALGEQEQLKEKVIEHIKMNFIKGLHEGNVNKTHREINNDENSPQLLSGNSDPKLKYEDFINFITKDDHNSHRFLLGFKIDGISIEYKAEKEQQKINLTITEVIGLDLLGINRKIRTFLEFSEPIKILYTTTIIKVMNLTESKYSPMQSISQVLLDAQIPRLNVVLCMPFIERLSSLTEFLTFDINTSRYKTTFNEYQNDLYFGYILKRKEQISQQMNLSVTIGKINCYLPNDYSNSTYQVVLHINTLKLSKREHDNESDEKKVITITSSVQKDAIFLNQTLEPLIISIQNLRALVVSDPQWEIIENPFYYDANFREKLKSSYITTLFEILQIYVSIEKLTHSFKLKNKVNIHPIESKLTVKLPLIMMNYSIKNIHILMDVIKEWTTPTPHIRLAQIKNSVKTSNNNGQHNESMRKNQQDKFAPEHSAMKDRHLSRTKIIDHNIPYEKSIVNYLESLILSHFEFYSDGLIINLNCEDQTEWEQRETHHKHQNKIMSIYLNQISVQSTTKYFDSTFTIGIKQFMIEKFNHCKKIIIKDEILKVYNALLAEEEKILNEMDPNTPHHPTVNQTRTTHTSKEAKPKHLCKDCHDGSRCYLMVNFLNDADVHSDVEVIMKSISTELQKVNKVNTTQSSINVVLQPLTMVLDPDSIREVKMMLDYAGVYAITRYSSLVRFMKAEAFWPEINIDDYRDGGNEVQEVSKQENTGTPLSSIEVNLPVLNVIFLHQKKSIYLLNMLGITVLMSSYLRDSEMRLTANSLTFYNTASIAGPHKTIIASMEAEDTLTVHMKMYGRYTAMVKNYSTWVGVKLKRAKIVFLKKVVQEVIEYLRKQLLQSIGSQIISNGPEDIPTEYPRSDMKLEVILLGTIVELMRNSLDESGSVFAHIDQLGVWSTGKWGSEPGSLVDTGRFEFEEDPINDETNPQAYEDAHMMPGYGLDQSLFKEDASPKMTDGVPGSFRSNNYRFNQPPAYPQDTYKIRAMNMVIKTKKDGDDSSIFMKLAQKSLELEVFFEDLEYNIKEKGQKEYPMKLKLYVPSLKVFTYQLEFNLFMQIVRENIGESPQTVVSDIPPDPYWDEDVWLVVELKAENALIKTYVGDRWDLVHKFAFPTDENVHDYIHKNPNSLALLTLTSLDLKFRMQKRGNKKLFLNVKEVDLYDMRYKTKISKTYRKLLGSHVAKKFKVDEETTTTADADNFQGEAEEHFDIELEDEKDKKEEVTPEVKVEENPKSDKKKDNKKKTKKVDLGQIPITEKEKEGGREKGLNTDNEKDKEHLIEEEGQVVEQDNEMNETKHTRLPVLTWLYRKLRGCCKRKKKDPNATQNATQNPAKSEERDLKYKDMDKNGIPMAEDHYMSIEFNPPPYDQNGVRIEEDNLTRDIIDEMEPRPTKSHHTHTVEFKKVPSEHGSGILIEETDPRKKPIEKLTLAERYPLYADRWVINELGEAKPVNLEDASLTEHEADNELFVYFEGGWDAEKMIYVYLNNKTFILAMDIVWDLLAFFKMPFTDLPDPPYVKMTHFNNWTPMRVKVQLNNFSVVMLSSFDDKQEENKDETKPNAMVLMTNILYAQEWFGDVGFGPGKGNRLVELTLKKLLAVHSRDIFSPYSTKLSKMDEQGTTFSLIEMFRITYNAIYTIDYYIPRYHNTEATHEQFIEFRNFYKLRNNFIFSTEHLNLLQLIVANVNGYSADPFEVNIIPGVGQKWNPPLPPIITTYKVKIFRLKINLIKMVQSSELAHISLNKVILRAKNHLDSTIMRSKMIIDILYHNKRKMNFEPFLEPWCFTIRYKALGEEKLLEIGNWQPPSKDNELEEQRLNRNALNLNISVAAVETILELVQLFTNQMKEAEPYLIRNYTGFKIKITASNLNNQIRDLDNKQNEALPLTFFRHIKKKKLYRENRTKSYMDLDVIGGERSVYKLNELGEPHLIVEPKNESHYLTNYKAIKQIDCDMIGKKYFKIKSKRDTATSPTSKVSKRHFDFPFFANKKGGDQSSVFLISSVHLNPRTGAKEMILRSSAIIKNNLSTQIKIHMQYKNKATSTYEIFEYLVDGNNRCHIPIEVIDENTKISFQMRDYESQEQKLESLSQMLDDKVSKDDYSEDEDGVNSADEYKENQVNVEKCLRSKRDINIVCKRDGEEDRLCFSLTKLKKKININAIQGAQDESIAFETFILLNPIIKFSNATVRPVQIVISNDPTDKTRDLKSEPMMPGQTSEFNSIEYHEDMEIVFFISGYEPTKARKIFKKGEKSVRASIEFKPEANLKSRSILFLTLESKYISENSRHLTLFCPYLIVNEAKESLIYQEVGLTSKFLSDDPLILKYDKMKKKSDKYKEKEIDIMHELNIERQSDEESYNRIHMFSTSKKMTKIQISIKSGHPVWSKPFSLDSADGVVELIESKRDTRQRKKEQNTAANILGKVTDTISSVAKILQLQKKPKKESAFKRKKYEFSVITKSAPSHWHRSKMLIITPRFAIKNETDQYLMMTQFETENNEDTILKIKQNSWEFFHWPDHKKPPHCIMSITDGVSLKPHGWSGRFLINQVDEFTVKLPRKDKSKSIKSSDNYYFARVIVSFDSTTTFIRILGEDLKNPPYRINNQTNFEISYRQKSGQDVSEKKLIDSTFQKLGPLKEVPFTWDDMVVDKFLEIDIEGKQKEYSLDNIKDYDPISIREEEVYSDKSGRTTLKKGFLGRKRQYDDEYEEAYCVLSVLKQKLKIYNKDFPAFKQIIPLKAAKIDDFKDKEFVINVELGKKLQFFAFRAKSEQEALEWVDFIKRAAFINSPNMIHVKIDPVNSTKVITFYILKNEKQEEMREERNENQVLREKKLSFNQSFTMRLVINNMIGISIIDSYPKEILSVTITNLIFAQTQTDDYDDTQDSSNVGNNANEATWTRTNVKIHMFSQKIQLNFSLDSLVINNQQSDAQFPVILARNRKYNKNIPFIYGNYLSRNPKKQTSETTLNYITQLNFFIDTFEIRIDDATIDAILSMYGQIPFMNSDEGSEVHQVAHDFTPLQQKFEKKIRMTQSENKRIYVKHLTLEPIDICFTFRNAPGHKFGNMAANFLTDFGLVLASIDSAKIRLNYLQSTHIFGSKDDIVDRITKHYTRQFLTQLYKLFGSIELLGNPVSLIENLGTGVVELFYEPLSALLGKRDSKHGNVANALAYGAVSFISHSVSGISSTIYNITKTIMKGLATLTADQNYLRKRQRVKNRKIKSIKEGLLYGLRYFINTFIAAFFGIFTEPCRNGKLTGCFGVIKGLYIGFVGMALKPIVSIYDFMIMLIQGIKNSAKYEEHVMDNRSRPPRLFGENNLIVNYDWSNAMGKDIIRRLIKKKHEEHEKMVFYDEITLLVGRRKKKIVYQIMITDLRFLFVQKGGNPIMRVKLYKIKDVIFDPKNNLFTFNLLVPLKGNKKPKVSFTYESENKANILLYQFNQLKLAELPSGFVVTDFMKEKVYKDDQGMENQS